MEEKVEEVERRVMEDMRASQRRDWARGDEMEEMRDQMRVMSDQLLSLLPSQLRLCFFKTFINLRQHIKPSP